MSNLTDPVKIAFGRFMQGFHAQLYGDTAAVREFAQREFSKAAVFAPGRMVDQVEQMLEAWRKNDTSQSPQPRPHLPIMIAAMTRDFVAAPPEFARNHADWSDVIIPADTRNRVFRMRVVIQERRTQVVVIAADEPSAQSIALQLQAYCSAFHNRRFAATYKLAGFDSKWPVQLEIPDLMAPSLPSDQKNMTLLAADITLRATVPLLMAPRSNEPNDGQGTGPNQDDPFAPGYDPSGYPVVIEARGRGYPPLIGAPHDVEWIVP